MATAKLTKQGTANMLNEFRATDPRYMDMIPEATVDNILAVSTAISKFPRLMNEFTGIMEKVAESFINSPSFTNPLSRFKNHSLEYGAAIEEIFLKLTRAKAFNPTKSTERLFQNEEPSVEVAYHKVTRKNVYEVSISDVDMRTAFTSENGLNNLMNRILQTPITSNERDMYVLEKLLLESAYKAGSLYYVEVGDDFKNFVKRARAYAGKIPFPTSNTYNEAGVENSTSVDNMNLFLSADTNAEIDVDVLASAFNMSNTEFLGRKMVVDKLADDNVLGIMVDDSFFVVADYVNRVETFRDPSALTTKYFFHYWDVVSRSPFATAIAFVKEMPEWAKYRLTTTGQVAVVGGYVKEEEINVTVDRYDTLNKSAIPEYTLSVSVNGDDIEAEVVDNKVIVVKPTADATRQAINNVTIKTTIGEEEFEKVIPVQVSEYYKLK